MRPHRHLALPAALGACLTLAACSGASTAVSLSAPAELPQATAGGTGGSAAAGSADSGSVSLPAHGAAGGGAGAGTTSGSSPAPGVDIGRPQGRVERHVDAAFRIPHGNFRKDFDDVIARATGIGGFVVDSSTQTDADGRLAGGVITVRVPAERLSQLVSTLPDSEYEVSAINYSSIDHTAQTVDLGAQLKAAGGHIDALEGLLAKTQNLQEITTLEEQIAQVQEQIDQFQGQLNAVNDAVDLATARIRLAERDLTVPPPPSASPLADAVRDGWSNSVAVVSFLLLTVVTALPMLVVVSGLLAVRRWMRRRPGTAPAAEGPSGGRG